MKILGVAKRRLWKWWVRRREEEIHNFSSRSFIYSHKRHTASTPQEDSKIMLSRFRVTLIVVVSHKENKEKKKKRKLYDSRHWVIILSTSQCLERHTQLYALNIRKNRRCDDDDGAAAIAVIYILYKAKQTQIIIFSSHFLSLWRLARANFSSFHSSGVRVSDERRLH